VAQRLNLPPERFFSNIAHYGNTSAASIPIALAEAARRGLLGPGNRVALVGFGAGLTWATCLLAYQPLVCGQTGGGKNRADSAPPFNNNSTIRR